MGHPTGPHGGPGSELRADRPKNSWTRALGALRSAAAVSLGALVLCALVPASAEGERQNQKTASTQEAPQPADPLGRTTPRDTIVAFLRAADREDFATATRYLQATQSQRRDAENLARDLKLLLDRYFNHAVGGISDSPEGALNDGLPADRERIGPLTISGVKADITLVRVTDPQAGPIWLISSETLAQVPQLRRLVAPTWIEREMPDPLVRSGFLGISWAQWIMLATLLIVPILVLALASSFAIALARAVVQDEAYRRHVETWFAATRWPAVTVLALGIHLMSMMFLGLPLTFRYAWGRVGLAVAILAMAWLVRRILTLGFERARAAVWGKNQSSTQSLFRLGERFLQVIVVLVAAFAILVIAGVDTTTVLAALSVGGVALALGAQKTVENFLGGVFLLTDKAIAVGDLCSISNRLGWVEDITLRSVRLRTLDQTLLSLPAGALSQAGIENFATREKILVQSTLRLRYGTSVTQLQRILGDIEALLAEDARIEAATSRIRLVDFGPQAVELELFTYVLTSEFARFLAVRQELLLNIAAIVEAAGSGFAQPTQFIHMGKPGAETPMQPRAAEAPKDTRPSQPIARATT